MFDDLFYLGGNDIPFYSANLIIHNPSIKEVSLIGEENFFLGCELLNFSKNTMGLEEVAELEALGDFDIFAALMQNQNPELQKRKDSVNALLGLLFPNWAFQFIGNKMLLWEEEDKDKQNIKIIDQSSFGEFKEILVEMFCLKPNASVSDYNPGGDMARSIIKKIEERKRKLAEQYKCNSGKINILCRYVSILSVGQQKDMNSILNYTVYQLFDEFHRYQLKLQSDSIFQARMAGAQNLPEVEDWMKDIHSESIENKK